MATTEYSPTARNALRIVGAVLALGGLALAIYGGFAIAHASPSDQEFFAGDSSGPGFAQFAPLVAGMFMVVIGLGCLNAGFLGAQARYAANETSGAVRTVGSAFRGEDAERSEPRPRGRSEDTKFCSECGERNDRAAKFCDACGHGIG